MFKKVLFVSVVFLFLGIAVFLGMTDEPLVDVVAQLEQAQAYVESGNYEQAEAIYKTVVTGYPATDYALEAQKNLAILYIAWGKAPQAQAAYERLITDFSLHPALPEAVYGVADKYQILQRHEQGRDVYQYVADEYPESEWAVLAQMDVVISNIELGKDSEAQAATDKLLADFAVHPDLPEALNKVADKYQGLQRHEQAIKLYQYIANNWPESDFVVLAQRDVAISNIELGKDSEAQAATDKLLADFAVHPGLPEALYKVADKYQLLQRHEQAKQLYQYIVDNWPQSDSAVWAQMDVAITNNALGDDPNAQKAIDTLIADFNDHPDLGETLFRVGEEYYIKAIQYKMGGLAAQAEDYFKKAIALWDVIITKFPEAYPAAAEACLFAGTSYRRLGQYEKAIEYYQKVVSNWPDYHNAGRAQFLIGKCYENLRDAGTLAESEANEMIKQAYEAVVQKYPDCPLAADAWGKLGWLNFEKGQWAKAAECFELSLQKSPEDRRPVNVLYPLGRAYEEMGQLDLAVQGYEEFIKTVYPGDPRIEKVKARLEQLASIK